MSIEVARYLEANPELLAAFTDTFIARWDTHPYQLPNGSYNRAHKNQPDGSKFYYPLLPSLIEGHLKGQITLGAYIMDSTSTTTKIVFDDDDETLGTDRLKEL